jgi:hypothetical protein
LSYSYTVAPINKNNNDIITPALPTANPGYPITAIDRGDTTAIGGDIIYSTQEYLHQFWTNFERNIAHGGGSGDSGGIFL